MRPVPASMLLLLAGLLSAEVLAGQAPESPASDPRPLPVGTMSELMIHVLYPASDAIFYIESRTPTTSEEWGALETKALMLAESANLLMMPGRARDDGQWMRDALLLRNAGQAAFLAARVRDVDALVNLNEQLYESCVACHQHYRPGYGRGSGQ